MCALFSSFSSQPTGTISIACYHCGREQEVGRRAMTVTCKYCSKPLQVSDVQVKKYDARREIRTVGTIVVEKKGRVVAKSVECGGLVARGEVTSNSGGKTVVRGAILAGPKSTLAGTVEARTIQVSDGASLNGFFLIGKEHMTPPPPPVIEPDDEPEAESMPEPAAIDAPAEAEPDQPDEALSASAAGV